MEMGDAGPRLQGGGRKSQTHRQGERSHPSSRKSPGHQAASGPEAIFPVFSSYPLPGSPPGLSSLPETLMFTAQEGLR